MSWVYVQSEPSLWTVGFYDPDGRWNPDSDHGDKTAAAQRVHYLNGGVEPEELDQVKQLTFVDANKFKKGQIVDVYSDPLTGEEWEGEAELLKLIRIGRDFHYWKVKFVDDGETTVRKFHCKVAAQDLQDADFGIVWKDKK